MQKDINPEEKLLRLIRNKNKASISGVSETAQTPQGDKPKSILTPYQKKIPSFLSQDLIKNIFSLRKLKVFLISLVIIFLGYGVFEILFLREGSVEHLKPVEKVDLKAEKKETPIPSPQPFEHYAGRINKRDIFNPPFAQEQGTKSPYQEQIANLRLAGIIVDKQPQAIIEDTKLKKTYFLNTGDYIGDIKVEEILESKVVLSYAGERFELVP